jgi:hypothetical protein
VIELPDQLGVYQVGCTVNHIPRTPVRAVPVLWFWGPRAI